LFLPLYDQAGFRHIKRPLGVYLILGANILVFALTSALYALRPELSFGMIPAVVFGSAILPDSVFQTPAFVTPFTSVFLHGGFEHIIGNMLFLWVFGDNVEDAMGTPRFIIFYLLCGCCAAMAHAIAMPHSHARS
jgi:membrane associated rhomboid family serine protease